MLTEHSRSEEHVAFKHDGFRDLKTRRLESPHQGKGQREKSPPVSFEPQASLRAGSQPNCFDGDKGLLTAAWAPNGTGKQSLFSHASLTASFPQAFRDVFRMFRGSLST
jgi:hypothetical protein